MNKDSLTERLGIMLWHIRITQKKKVGTVAHRVKITTSRLEQLEKGLHVGNIDIYARVATVLKVELWEVLKDCQDDKVFKPIYNHFTMKAKILKDRGLT